MHYIISKSLTHYLILPNIKIVFLIDSHGINAQADRYATT